MSKQKLGPLQEEWLRCLESGEWKQGNTNLCQLEGEECRYCCLGVACEVAIERGIEVERLQLGRSINFDRNIALLPHGVQDAFRFRSAFGDVTHAENLDGWASLASANDAGVTFKQIAAFVRQHPEAVFTGPA